MMRGLVLALLFWPLVAGAETFALGPGILNTLIPAARESREIVVVVEPGLTSMAGLPTNLRAARTAMHDGLPVTDADLRALALRGDGLAALRLMRRMGDGSAEASASDIAYFGAIALRTGRAGALAPMVDALLQLDPATEPPERIATAIQALLPQAWAGNALALDAVIDLNGPGRLFGELSAGTLARIEEQATLAGDGRAFLRLAIQAMQAPDDPAARARAEDYLRRAAVTDHLGVKATVEALLAQLAASAPAETVTQ